MRNWMKTLRPASFRGVPFHVEGDGPEVGRRVAVHEISGGEAPVTQDMGRRAVSTTVTAYVTGDAADLRGLALEAACAAPEASLLVLPMDAPRGMRCIGCRRSRRTAEMGIVMYILEFVEAGGGGAATPGGLGALRTVFATGLAAAVSALAGVL